MSANPSLLSNSSIPSSPSSPFVSMYEQLANCMNSTTGMIAVTTYTITSCLVILPLCVFILCLGFQRWRQQRSSATTSPSDLITYHQLVIELLNIFGYIISCCGLQAHLTEMVMLGVYLWYVNLAGQMNFHLLACIERYLAVVHPITYLSLKKKKGIMLRNVCIGSVWLFCFGIIFIMFLKKSIFTSIIPISLVVFVIVVVSFCSLSVLSVLNRPGPGDRGRQHVDKSKLRAFYTIMSIAAALMFRLGSYIVIIAMHALPQLAETTRCGILLSSSWFGLPSCLMLSLLSLHRAGKLACCRSNNQSGQGKN